MDFFHITMKEARGEDGVFDVSPDFIVGRSKDLMIRGQSFYAIWDEEKGIWSTDEYDVIRLVDAALRDYAEKKKLEGIVCKVKPLKAFSNGGWKQFRLFMKNVSDNSHQLDSKLTFANTEVKKTDYTSRRLPYSLAMGDHSAWDELVGFLYSPEERAKIEWSIGAIIAGEAKKIEKFLVFYGSGGKGKSTIMKIIQKLFGGLTKDGGYVKTFEAKALVGANNGFATSTFKDNPLVAIQHDGDLSKIEDNSKLNSIISHEDMEINEKFKSGYDSKIDAFLFMGTNKPVKITDAKSGLIRRLIDVRPTGDTFPIEQYNSLMSRIDFELGAIAYHCLQVYNEMGGKKAYGNYTPKSMMYLTDVFFNYIEEYYDVFKEQDGVTLQHAWDLYKEYAKEAQLTYNLQKYKFREALKDYFDEFHDRIAVDGIQRRSYYKGFNTSAFTRPESEEIHSVILNLDEEVSLLDDEYADMPAQYAKANGNPKLYWTDEEKFRNGEMVKPKPSEVVSTTLKDLDTSKLHYVKIPENHIVIDFDLTDENGEKSREINLAEAANWPTTYAEFSKSGEAVHLHYIYDGDVHELASMHSPGIEVKTLLGDSGLRRKLTKCNAVPIATISSGLPIKEKKVFDENATKDENYIRNMIMKNLRRGVHPGTKPSIDFIAKILDDAQRSGVIYDVSDLKGKVAGFAAGSTNQGLTCMKIVKRMKFKSDDDVVQTQVATPVEPADDRKVFFDCEVYPNLFVVCWKYQGSPTISRMIDPSPTDIGDLLKFKLIGFNNRSYDNHILWARYNGYNNEELYKLSHRLVALKDNKAKFSTAYGLSYTDVYDWSPNLNGLKWWEIELGLPHIEMDIPWDQPVPPELVMKVVDYCCNDVTALEALFDHLEPEWTGRQILADLSGLTVNDTNRKHTERIIFGDERQPQREFVYTDLSKEFPGYVFDEFNTLQKSTYRGEDPGEGGYVYAEPGMYENVALLDVASMHPTSIEIMNAFGPYTGNYIELKNARLALKHGEFDKARGMLGGKLAPYLEGLRDGVALTAEQTKRVKALSNALKLVINSVYGYTSARFENTFRDPRNKDNIVAKRGALFMIDLKYAVQEQGFTVAHIKTDSIKIPNATPEIIEFVMQFGKKYGYDFEHEGTYEKFCLVNDAVYVAKAEEHVEAGDAMGGNWTATGAQFKHPYVFKMLFSGEPLTFEDFCETKRVKDSAMYLDFQPDEGTPADRLSGMHHVGRTGRFVPVTPEANGGVLYRVKDGNLYAVTGTKGYTWHETGTVKVRCEEALERMAFERVEDAVEGTGSIADIVDMSYFEKLTSAAIDNINKFGDFKEFVK